MKSVLISTRPKLVEKICHKIGEDETGKAMKNVSKCVKPHRKKCRSSAIFTKRKGSM